MNSLFCVGVQVILAREGKILLCLRKNVFGAGHWSLPGGRLEKGETIQECGIREMREELAVNVVELAFAGVASPVAENNFHLQICMLATQWDGEPLNIEPQKCEALGFFSTSDLPSNTFPASSPFLAILDRILEARSALKSLIP